MNTHHSRRPRSRLLALLVGAGLIAVTVPIAHSAPIEIDDSFTLTGAGPPASWWDPDGGGSACETSSAYTPVDDGSAYRKNGTELGDAYDDGLMLRVGTADFDPPENSNGDSIGNLLSTSFGQGLRVGPRALVGLRVVRTDVVRKTRTATMRSLIAFRNPGNQARARNVIWESNFGSDGETLIQRTSSGDKSLTKGDRWIVTSDDNVNAGLSDPPLVHVLNGTGKVRSVRDVVCAPDGGGSADDLSVEFRIKVPPKSVRYLLFFSEMNTTNNGGIRRARSYNSLNGVRPLLQGLSRPVRNKVMNWNL